MPVSLQRLPLPRILLLIRETSRLLAAARSLFQQLVIHQRTTWTLLTFQSVGVKCRKKVVMSAMPHLLATKYVHSLLDNCMLVRMGNFYDIFG